jgi:hypothetical protein
MQVGARGREGERVGQEEILKNRTPCRFGAWCQMENSPCSTRSPPPETNTLVSRGCHRRNRALALALAHTVSVRIQDSGMGSNVQANVVQGLEATHSPPCVSSSLCSHAGCVEVEWKRIASVQTWMETTCPDPYPC